MRARLLAPENRKWWTLAAVSFGLFMIMLDNTIVNVALPSIQRDLDIRLSELEWIVNGYALTFAVLMLTGGKLADMLGRRRIFIVGLAIFTLASLACGLAPSAHFLIGARVVQGAGAALMNPATLSIITATFPPRQRGTAIGIWAGTSAMALAIGPLVGGVITQYIDWSWIFFINVPIGILGIVVARLVIDESRDTSHEQRLDLPGLVTSAVGLFGLTYGLIEANKYGWTSTRILVCFAIAIVGLGLFAFLELRQRLPMLDLRSVQEHHLPRRERDDDAGRAGHVRRLLLRLALPAERSPVLPDEGRRELPADDDPDHPDRAFRGPVLGQDRLSLAGRHRDAARGGLAPDLLAPGPGQHVVWDLFPGLIVGGVGMALTMTPTTAAAMGSVEVDKAGVGSAVLNSMRQVGGSLGIAIMGAIVAASLQVPPTDPRAPAQFVTGFQHALEVAAIIAFAAALIAIATIRQYRHTEAVEAPA